MNFKQAIVIVILIFGCLNPTAFFASSFYIPMKASFSNLEADKFPCDSIFKKTNYDIDFHILNQPRGAVIRFKNKEGFFGNSNLVARRGYDDLYIEKTLTQAEFPNLKFRIKGEGIYSTELLLIDFEVEAHDESRLKSLKLCTAKAQLFAN